jgi:hypothetical protein
MQLVVKQCPHGKGEGVSVGGQSPREKEEREQKVVVTEHDNDC